MSENLTCKICAADFRSLENGKCVLCNKLYPDSNSLKEAKEKKNPKSKENEGHLHNIILEKIYDVLHEHGILVKCECGNAFFRRSPAMKKCVECKDKKEVIKETSE